MNKRLWRTKRRKTKEGGRVKDEMLRGWTKRGGLKEGGPKNFSLL